MSQPPPPVDALAEHRLNLRELGDVRAFVGIPDDTKDKAAAVLAVCYGDWETRRDAGLLVRVQSSCVYGEVFGSTNCDCYDQLKTAMLRIQGEGAGIIVYLNQEGRGAGLLTKAKGYQVSQQERIDSFTAYERLGECLDKRDYSPAAWILSRLGVTFVRLLTNNPRKIEGLTDRLIKADREPLWVGSPKAPDTLGLYLGSKLMQGHLS